LIDAAARWHVSAKLGLHSLVECVTWSFWTISRTDPTQWVERACYRDSGDDDPDHNRRAEEKPSSPVPPPFGKSHRLDSLERRQHSGHQLFFLT
jgi:hypothetical protein